MLHPRASTDVFDDAGELEDAYAGGELRPLPSNLARARTAASTGAWASSPGGSRSTASSTAGCAPRRWRCSPTSAEACSASRARARRSPSRAACATSAYQDLLARRNSEATRAYSLHTTGYSFDIRRLYRSKRQAEAFQYLLDRLQALNLIAWVREPGAIHITASSEASAAAGRPRSGQ